VIDMVFAKLQEKTDLQAPDRSAFDGQHRCENPSRRGRRMQKNGTQSIGVSRGGRNTKIHMVAASDRIAIAFHLSAGKCHDSPQGRLLLEDRRLNEPAKRKTVYMVMDRGYEDDLTRKAVKRRGFKPVVPPKSNRKKPWKYSRKI
jgi:hypothetical protein